MMKKLFNQKHVCPWWLCFTFDNPIRRVVHDPVHILSPFIRQGDTVIDIGSGMGYFSMPMAELVGSNGRVIAIDVQQKMLFALLNRAQKKGVACRIKTHLAKPDSLCFHDKADFILAFWMVHEIPDQKKFLSEVRDLMKPDGFFLFVEPLLHVSRKNFERTVETAKAVGFLIKETPEIRLSRSALFTLGKDKLLKD